MSNLPSELLPELLKLAPEGYRNPTLLKSSVVIEKATDLLNTQLERTSDSLSVSGLGSLKLSTKGVQLELAEPLSIEGTLKKLFGLFV